MNPGIYEYRLTNGVEECIGSFQISIKEFLWQSWIHSLEPHFQELSVLEGRFKNPIHLVLLEITYPPDILNLSNSPWVLRNYAQASNCSGIRASFDWFASGLLQNNTIFSRVDFALTDEQSEYSKLSVHFTHPTLARRGFFLQQRDPGLVTDANWNYAIVEDSESRVYTQPQVLNYLSTITVHTNVEAAFTLYNSEMTRLYDLDLDHSDPTGFYYKTPHLFEGIYYVASSLVPGYWKPDNETVALPPREELVLEMPYQELHAIINLTTIPPASWTITGHRGTSETKVYQGFSSQKVYIFDDVAAGFDRWNISLDPTPGFIQPPSVDIYPAQYQNNQIDVTMSMYPSN